MRVKWVIAIILLVSLFLSACDLLPSEGDSDTVEESDAATVMPAATVEVAENPPVFEIPATATPAAVDLKVWIPPQIAVLTEAGTQTMADQFTDFNARNPEIVIRVEQKRVLGDGGILSYLRTGRSVAPSVLPDLIAIPTELLLTATNESLIYPLDDQVDPDLLDELFPPALAMARPEERTLGIPFALTWLPHLVYNSNALTTTVPLTWDRLISDTERSMVFAADGTDGALLALQFYLDAGGTVENELGQPTLQVEPLTIALEALQKGRETGFLIEQSSSLNGLDQSWQIFLGGGANIVRTSSDYFLGENITGLPLEFTVTPGIDRPLTPLVGGWAWAISTSDPDRQEPAIALMLDLVTASNQGEWSQNSNILPARRDSLATWSDNDLYVGFIQQELERARPWPVTSNSKIMTVLGDAVFQVVSGSKLAQEAAEDAVAALQS
jgi:ABC-type glycerol-3-phosphate transport system substrate-binding protein